MPLQEHDIRLIEDFIVESLTEDSLEEFAVKKATSKEFNDLLFMQDEVLHDLTEELYKIPRLPLDPVSVSQAFDNEARRYGLSFDRVGLALMVISGAGLIAMVLVLLTLSTGTGSM